MSWRDRDYSRRPADETSRWQAHLPPPGTQILLVLHLLGLVLAWAAAGDPTARDLLNFRLYAGHVTMPAVLLHPFAAQGFSVLLPLVALWWLGSELERAVGTARLLWLYAFGTLCAGAGFAGAVLLLGFNGTLALAHPVGALAAWALTGWLRQRETYTVVRGRLISVGKLIAISAGVITMLIIFIAGQAAAAWTVGVLAALAAVPLTETTLRLTHRNRRPAVSRAARRPPPAPPPARGEEPDIDVILDKIHREGLDALTDEERERLESARRAKLRRP